MSTDEGLGPDPTSQALIRLVPTLGPIVATWRQETHERRKRRAEQLGAVAAEDIGVEQLFEQLANDERLTDIFNAAVDAAIATSSDAKIRLLGRVLAAGAVAEDEAKVDEAEQLLRIALELDPVDLRALCALERWRAADATSDVAYALDIGPAIAGPIVARLERLHLIVVERMASVFDKKDPDDDQVSIDEEWTVTATAEGLMNLLRERSNHHHPDAPRAPGVPWAGFTDAQADALETLAGLSHHEWHREPRPNAAVARTLSNLQALGVSYSFVRDAMRSVGFKESKLKELDRWGA